MGHLQDVEADTARQGAVFLLFPGSLQTGTPRGYGLVQLENVRLFYLAGGELNIGGEVQKQ